MNKTVSFDYSNAKAFLGTDELQKVQAPTFWDG